MNNTARPFSSSYYCANIIPCPRSATESLASWAGGRAGEVQPQQIEGWRWIYYREKMARQRAKGTTRSGGIEGVGN